MARNIRNNRAVEDRVGATPLERAGGSPGYTPGYGRSSAQNSAGGKTSEAAWGAMFPTYAGSNFTKDGVYDSSGDPAHVAASRVPNEVNSAELGSRTPGVVMPGFNTTGVRSGDAFTPESVYDPAQDRLTPRQGDQIHSQYGDASVSTDAPPKDWIQQIVQKHPDIGVAGTPANLAFTGTFNKHGDWRRAMSDADTVMGHIGAQNTAQQDAANLTRNAPGAGRNSPIGDVYADNAPAPAAGRNGSVTNMPQSGRPLDRPLQFAMTPAPLRPKLPVPRLLPY